MATAEVTERQAADNVTKPIDRRISAQRRVQPVPIPEMLPIRQAVFDVR
jgi:hypothetical protein